VKGAWWVVSYVGLWLAVVVLCLAVAVLLRQIGVLHARLAPMGTHFAGEGPLPGEKAAPGPVDYGRHTLTLLVFSSQTCVICRELRPSFDAIRRSYREVHIEMIELESQPRVFDAFKVRSTPYVVAVDRNASVVGAGVANTLEQIEELLRESLSSLSDSAMTDKALQN
jgi:thiol-disulfide isomerase/thioredoxin